MPLPYAPMPIVQSFGGMVATADALATQAGVAMLRGGGNAVDAAVAAGAVMAVVAPHLCGMGGDLFALVHDGSGPPVALDASGHAGSGANAAALRGEGHTSMPFRNDIRAVTVPGCVDGWTTLHARFGRLPLASVVADAIALASDGFPCSPLLALSAAALSSASSSPPPGSEDLTNPVPAKGARVRRPGVARTLAAVATSGRDPFYGGEFGKGLLGLGNGWFTRDDLTRVHADWVEPLVVEAFGHRIWSTPPATQGYLTLAGAWIATGLPLPTGADDPAFIHLLVEAALAAGHDRPAVLHDGAKGDTLVAPDRLAPRRAAIDPDRAGHWTAPTAAGDTTYLCAVDGGGLGVSLIQSNAGGFGSGIFEPSTGIGLQNRGIGFSLEPGHPAELAPGRRPPHTLCPALVSRRDGSLAAVLGTMGGDSQPQIVLQLLARLLHLGEEPRAALSAPRVVLEGAGSGFDTWTSPDGPGLRAEGHAPDEWLAGLAARGHQVRRAGTFGSDFGHACVICVDEHGRRSGGADPRTVVGSCAPA